MQVKDILKALEGIPENTEIRVTNEGMYEPFDIQGVYYEEGTPVDIEVGVWRGE